MVAICCAFAAVLVAAPAQAAKKPDLVVSSVKTPAVANVGEQASVTVVVKNAGKKSASKSTTGLILGGDAKLENGRLGTLASLATPGLRPGKTTTIRKKVDIPLLDLVGASPFVVACADDEEKLAETKETNNCRTSGTRMLLRPELTPFDRIDAEFKAGEIDEGEALLYKAYAQAGDPRLPTRFGTPADDTDSNTAVKEIADRIEDTPVADQELLDPFIRPPIYEGAYIPDTTAARAANRARLRGTLGGPRCAGSGTPPVAAAGWSSLTTTHFRIHYYTEKPNESAEDPAKSLAVAQQLQGVAEHVYDKETALWTVPLSDAALDCNGGDGRYDIYVVGMSWSKQAQVIPYPPGEVERPGWMYIDPYYISGVTDARDTLAHEFTHMITMAYDLFVKEGSRYEYGWLDEASATWAMDYVYPLDDYEWRFLNYWYDRAAWVVPVGECSEYGCGNGYRDYLFPFFLTHEADDTQVMAGIWSNTEAMGSIQSVDDALGGEFAESWKEFALHTMNRGEYNDFNQWDGIERQLELGPQGSLDAYDDHLAVALNGQMTRTQKLPLPLRGVAPKTFTYITYDFPDANAKDVTFHGYGWDNTNGGITEDAKITAWYELQNGDEKTENWTSGADQQFCRDRPEENVKKLVLFYTNGRATPYLDVHADSAFFPKPDGRVVSNKTPCDPPAYDGTFSGTSRRQSTGINILHTFSGTMRLEPTEGAPGQWLLTDGALDLTDVSGTAGGCTVSGGPGHYDLPANGFGPETAMFVFGESFSVNGPWPYNPALTVPMNYAGDGCNGATTEPLYAHGQWMFYAGQDGATAQPDGTITETMHFTNADWTHDLTFTLTPDYG